MLIRSLINSPRYGLRFDDPFFAVRTLQRSFDDACSASAKKTVAPVRLDVKEDEKAYTVTAELPGISDKEVDVTFEEGVLTIRGEKQVVRDEKVDTWHITERTTGSFERSLSLAKDVTADTIEAKFDKGILTVTLPKEAEPQKAARKIAIKTS